MKSPSVLLFSFVALAFLSSCEKDPVSTTIVRTDTLIVVRTDTLIVVHNDTVRVPLPFPYPRVSSLTSFVNGVSNPVSLAIDTAGNIYASDPVAGVVSRIMPNTSVQLFATAGTNVGAIAFSPSGDLYAACYGDGSLKKVGPAGGLMTNVKTGLNNPSGIAFDTVGNLFLSVHNQDQILRITPTGTESVFATILRPAGLVFDTQGNLLVGDQVGHAIRKIAPNGTQTVFAPTILSPHTLRYDAKGNLYVSSSNTGSKTVTVIATDGFTYQLSDQFSWPTGLVFDKSGGLYVANYASNSISKVLLTQ